MHAAGLPKMRPDASVEPVHCFRVRLVMGGYITEAANPLHVTV